jgi:hypothetical protein
MTEANKRFLALLTFDMQTAVMAAFARGDIKFNELVTVEHADHSLLEFENATILNLAHDVKIIVTEHMGYFPLLASKDVKISTKRYSVR